MRKEKEGARIKKNGGTPRLPPFFIKKDLTQDMGDKENKPYQGSGQMRRDKKNKRKENTIFYTTGDFFILS